MHPFLQSKHSAPPDEWAMPAMPPPSNAGTGMMAQSPHPHLEVSNPHETFPENHGLQPGSYAASSLQQSTEYERSHFHLNGGFSKNLNDSRGKPQGANFLTEYEVMKMVKGFNPPPPFLRGLTIGDRELALVYSFSLRQADSCLIF